MLFFILLLLATFLLCKMYAPEMMGYFVLTFILGLCFHLIFSLEYFAGSLHYFNSDELGYTLLQGNNFDYSEYPFRALWHFLNDLVYISGGGYSFANKLLALPFVIMIQLITYLAFDKKKAFILLMYLCPYFIYIGTMDLRDTLIILLCLTAFYASINKKYLLFSLSIILLMFLRPFTIVLILTPVILLVVIFRTKLSFYRKIGFAVLIFLMMIIISVVFSSVIDSYLLRVEVLLTPTNATSLKGEPIELSINGFITYISKWIFTPLPTSLLERLVESGGHNVFGFIDDFIRMIHQFFYFFCLIYTMLNVRYFLRGLFFGYTFLSEKANKFFLLLFSFNVLWSCVYILFALGSAHSRIKVVFTYFIVISAVCIFKEKNFRLARRNLITTREVK